MKEKYQLTKLYKYYLDSPLRSVKHSSYFLTYENLLEKYRNKPIVFVEVGIHNGGSLFMWRKFFGDNARIIGIDLNPNAKELEKYGFEIFIGNQSENSFWKNFYKEVGKIDILLDDGGHTYEQQINTVNKSVDFINNGGMIIVEDTHTSYLEILATLLNIHLLNGLIKFQIILMLDLKSIYKKSNTQRYNLFN